MHLNATGSVGRGSVPAVPHTVVNTKPDVPKSRSVPPAQQSGFVASEPPAAAPDETTGRVVDIKL